MPDEFFTSDILHLSGDEVLSQREKRDLIAGTLPILISGGYGTEKSIAFYRTAFQEANLTSIRDSVFRDIYRQVRDRLSDPSYDNPFDLLNPFARLPDSALPVTEVHVKANYFYYADIYSYNNRTGEIMLGHYGVYTASAITSREVLNNFIFSAIAERGEVDLTKYKIIAVVARGGTRKGA